MAAAIPTGPEQLLLALFVIFVSAKAIGELFERMNLPSVLGEIMAGALLGPYALGWIPISDTIHSVADLGVIFVLFSAGLETRPSDLIRIGGKSIRVAVAGVVVPFVLGFVYMKLRGDVSSRRAGRVGEHIGAVDVVGQRTAREGQGGGGRTRDDARQREA